MAVIDSKKLLPPSKSSGSALATQKFLVPVSNIKVKSSAIVKASDITPESQEGSDNKKTLLGELIKLKKNFISIQKIIGDNNSVLKKVEEQKRKLLENEKFAKKEKQLETKDPKQKINLPTPSLPRTGFLDAIKRFLFFTLLGAAFVKFGKHIPKILEFSKKLIPAFKFLEDFAGNVLNGVVDFIGAGYKAYDKVRDVVKSVGGDNAEKKFDEFSKQFNTFANLALIAGMSTMGGPDFGGKGGKKPAAAKPGFDRVKGGRVDKATQSRYLSRYGKSAFTNRFGQQSLKGLTGKGAGRLAGRALGKIPIIGGLVDFIISTVIFKEKPGRAAAKAIGATIGSALGTFIPVPFAGTILGGIVGDLVGGALYDTLVGNDTLKAKAQGGQVTRGGKKVSGPARRSIRAVRTRPTKIKPQKTIPGKDIGGKEEIKKLFPSPPDPRQRNPLGILETTSKNLKEIPLLGGIMGASVDLTMGQKPDPSIFRRIGNGFGMLIQNAIDAETSNTIGNIQKEIIGLAGGGVVPRTLTAGESIGMKIGERLAKTIEVMMNTKVGETLQAIRQQMTRQDIYGGVPGMDGGGGVDGGGQIPGDAPPEVKAMLEAISSGEGGWDSVNPGTTVPGLSNMTISKAREAAIQKGVNQMGGSGAMGKWQQMPQFVLSRARSAGLDPDRDKFSPENQTKIARMLMSSVYPGGEAQLVKDARKDPMSAAAKLRGTWPSLPGGSQANTTERQFRENYARSLQSYRSPQAVSGNVKDTGIKDSSGRPIKLKGVIADAFIDMAAAARKDGINLGSGISVALRDPEHNRRVGGSQGSKHLTGEAFDINWNSAAGKWIRNNASRFGFRYNPYSSQSTHFDWVGGYSPISTISQPKPVTRPASPQTSPPPSQQRTMMLGGKLWTQHPVTKNWTDQFGNRYSNPDFQNRIIQERKGTQASLAPSTTPNLASGVKQNASYEIASTLMIQRVIVEKQVPVPMSGGGGFVPLDSNSTSSSTASLSIG